VGAFLDDVLGGRMQARRGELIDVVAEAGLVAEVASTRVGLVGWRFEADRRVAEVTVLAVDPKSGGRGVGRALLEAGLEALRGAGVRRAWLVTTNDNLRALRLYQRAGWRLAALRPGAVDESRRLLKPSIPEIAEDGIPLRDELELEIELAR
jgi:ribosomal protein S18 acetylase RimI-like enzyme